MMSPAGQNDHGQLQHQHTAIGSLYRHVVHVGNVPVSNKANGDRYQLESWIDTRQ